MTAEYNKIEETPLTQARGLTIHKPSESSALLAEAKLLGGASDTFIVSTYGATWTTAFDVFETQHWTSTTTMATLRRRPTRTKPLHEKEEHAEDPVERVNRERVELLARQYVAKDKFSSEEEARLAIVTERVRKLLPGVTAAEYEALERHLQALQQVADIHAQVRAKLGKPEPRSNG